ncbi:MFS transporter [Mitsuokella jalaludinii]|uniref:MFS transporter n=1 Tax=Mitsuokella jalaludinii TaxID=187979 RepID=UPI00307EAFDB
MPTSKSISGFQRRADLRFFLSIIAAGLLSFTGVVIETAMNITFPTLMQEFAISTSTVQWITTGYLLILAIVIPTSSYLKQRFAMKRLFLAANLLFLTGTLLDATSASFAQLLFGRLLQGAGTGIALPLMFLIVMEQAPLDKMGLMMGAAMLVCALAPAVGPSVGGYIVSTFGWRMIFIALLPVLLFSLAAGTYAIRQSSDYGPRPFDSRGLILLGAAFTAFLLLTSYLHDLLSEPLLLLTVFSLLLFVRQEKRLLQRGAHPLLNITILRHRAFTLSAMGLLCFQFVCLGIGFLLPNFSQIVQGETAFTAGCILLPGCIVGAMFAPVSGRIYDSLGARKPLLTGSALLLLSLLLFQFAIPEVGTLGLTAIYVLFAMGQGLSVGNILTYGLSALPKAIRADGNAFCNTVQQLAGAVGTSIPAAIVAACQQSTQSLAPATSLGTSRAFLLLLFVGLLQALCMSIALRRTPAPHHSSHEC